MSQKAYTRINWKNYPNTETPLNETNLNRIDSGLNIVDDRVISMEVSKLDTVTGNKLLKDVTINNDTGVITLIALDGTTKTLNTNINKIAVNFVYDQSTQQLVLTLPDGSKTYISLAALVQNNDFVNSSTIGFSVASGGIVSAYVLNGSITEAHLRPDYLADIRVSEANARASELNAENFKDQTESLYVQTGDIRDATQDIKIDCAGIRADMIGQAETIEDAMWSIKEMADDDLTEISKIIGTGSFSVDFTTGHLMYTSDTYYTFTIDATTGHLKWEVV